jgi:hypothetical protein
MLNSSGRRKCYSQASSCDGFQVLDTFLLLIASQFPNIQRPCPAASSEYMPHSLPFLGDLYLQVSEAGSPLSDYQLSEYSSCLHINQLGSLSK